MNNTEITDTIFRQAVEAIGSGDIMTLEGLLVQHPALVQNRLPQPTVGYFRNPYLLWFVADNPIELGKLPDNIVEVTRLLVQTVKREAPDTAKQQIDYALALVATGRTPRECGVQIEVIDLLVDAGATPCSSLGALAHGNVAAAERLIERGGTLTLATAVGLDRKEDVMLIAKDATDDEKLVALTVAAFYGNVKMLSFLLGMGVNPNGYPINNHGFHQHATPLHQAVSSGSLECVILLVKAGASLDARDKMYDGTPLDWAEYLQREEGYDEAAKRNLVLIYNYLQEKKRA